MNLRVQGLLVILGAMLIGLTAGVIIERTRSDGPRAFWRTQANPRMPDRRGPRPSRLPPEFEQLELTTEQRRLVDSIFESWQPRTEAVMDSLMPRLRALRDSAFSDVERILTPEQRERFVELAPPDARGPGRARTRMPGRR